MRPNYYVLFILFYSFSGLTTELISTPYKECFVALEKRIQVYCNCEIQNDEYLILTSTSGLKARVNIDKTVNGLPDVAWVLNQVNRSGNPGRMRSFLQEKEDQPPRWVIEETVRKWDLENTKEGLSMSTPQKITRSFQFSIEGGKCEFQSLDLRIEENSTKIQKLLTATDCQKKATPTRQLAQSQELTKQIDKECESLYQLENK